jgi:hypothetical protein
MDVLIKLTNPTRLFSRSDVLTRPSPVPKDKGIYAWYFRNIPKNVPTDKCLKIKQDDLTLLYVGISPRNKSSSQNLHKRISRHFSGNAKGSTLRLSLGVLLEKESTFPLRRVGASGTTKTFAHLGEQWLDNWMERNAFVCWVRHSKPWDIEANIFRELDLPLNIQHNRDHPFASELSQARCDASAQAKACPIVDQHNQRRRVVPPGKHRSKPLI